MKEIGIKNYWTRTVDKVTSAWEWISGKTQKDMLQKRKELEEKISSYEIDIEALKIKLASTEIDLKASEIEKETIKMQLEEKKMMLVDLRLKLNHIESTTLSSDIEINHLIKQFKIQEEENENMKQKMLEIISMLALMSENEKYQDIVKIQTNTINEYGQENHNIYISYGGQTIDIKTEDMMEKTHKTEIKQERQVANEKIISFHPQTMFEEEDDLVEIAE